MLKGLVSPDDKSVCGQTLKDIHDSAFKVVILQMGCLIAEKGPSESGLGLSG